ncbi:hypothetical protein K439DRAFT_319652 [Ramaria rubella]|nr:hypothetical protein K439DRAFT_319652 [Ramaria rubella]
MMQLSVVARFAGVGFLNDLNLCPGPLSIMVLLSCQRGGGHIIIPLHPGSLFSGVHILRDYLPYIDTCYIQTSYQLLISNLVAQPIKHWHRTSQQSVGGKTCSKKKIGEDICVARLGIDLGFHFQDITSRLSYPFRLIHLALDSRSPFTFYVPGSYLSLWPGLQSYPAIFPTRFQNVSTSVSKFDIALSYLRSPKIGSHTIY